MNPKDQPEINEATIQKLVTLGHRISKFYSGEYLTQTSYEEILSQLTEFQKLEGNSKPYQEYIALNQALIQFAYNKQPSDFLRAWVKQNSKNPIAINIQATVIIIELAELSRNGGVVEQIESKTEELKTLLVSLKGKGIINLDGLNLSGIKLISVDLSQASLIGTNFSQTDLTDSNLNQANLKKAKLKEANLTAASLNSAHCQETDFTLAKLSSSDCNQTNFSYAKLDRIITNNTTSFVKANFTGASLDLARLEYCTITGAHFKEAKLERAILSVEQLALLGEIKKPFPVEEVEKYIKDTIANDLNRLGDIVEKINKAMYIKVRGEGEEVLKVIRPPNLDKLNKKIETALIAEGCSAKEIPARVNQVKSKFFNRKQFEDINKRHEALLKAFSKIESSRYLLLQRHKFPLSGLTYFARALYILFGYKTKTFVQKERDVITAEHAVITFVRNFEELKNLEPMERFNDKDGKIALEIINDPGDIFEDDDGVKDFINFQRRPIEKELDPTKLESLQSGLANNEKALTAASSNSNGQFLSINGNKHLFFQSEKGKEEIKTQPHEVPKEVDFARGELPSCSPTTSSTTSAL